MLQNLFLMETEITCLLKRDLNSWSRNTKRNLLTLALVNFSNKLMLSDWNWRTPISDMPNLEESKFDNTLRLEVSTKWENWRELKHYESTNSLYKNWEKVMTRCRDSLHKYKSCKRGWVARMFSGIFKRSNRITEENFLTFPVNQQAVIPSPRSMPSRDKRLPLDTWKFVWKTGKRFWQSTSCVRFITDTLSKNSSLYDWEHDYNADVWMKAVNHEVFFCQWKFHKFYGSTAKITDIGASVWQMPHSIIIYVLGDKSQNPSKFLFRFSLGCHVMDQRSGDGRFSGWIKISAISCSPEFRAAGRENRFCFY